MAAVKIRLILRWRLFEKKLIFRKIEEKAKKNQQRGEKVKVLTNKDLLKILRNFWVTSTMLWTNKLDRLWLLQPNSMHGESGARVLATDKHLQTNKMHWEGSSQGILTPPCRIVGWKSSACQ